MTLKEMQKFINRKVHIFLGGLRVAVVVMDVKMAYGKARYLVSPVTGTGEIWVEAILNI